MPVAVQQFDRVQYHLVEKIIGRIHFRPHLIEVETTANWSNRFGTDIWSNGLIRCSFSNVQTGRIYTIANRLKIGRKMAFDQLSTGSK